MADWYKPDKSEPALLAGVKVVELATVIAAPTGACMLADFGADVIKVERLGVGDTWRLDRAHLTPDSAWGGGPHFANNNRGKRSIQIDVKDPTHLAALQQLIGTADVFLTNVRPKALERCGLCYPSLAARFPRLVYAILTAWGLRGPKADDPGYDVGAFWAASGMQDFTRHDDGDKPGNFPPGAGDHITSMQLVAGVALALLHRQTTGRGQLVDTCLLRSGIFGLGYPMLNVACAPGQKMVREPRTHHYRPSFNCYKCADGAWLQLLGLDHVRLMPRLLRALGLAAADVAGKDEAAQIALFDALFAQHDSAHFERRLAEEDMWYQRVQRLDEVLRDEACDEAFVRVPWADFPLVACPLQMGCSDKHGPAGPPPVAGEHTTAVLGAAGVDEAAIAKIVRDQAAARAKL